MWTTPIWFLEGCEDVWLGFSSLKKSQLGFPHLIIVYQHAKGETFFPQCNCILVLWFLFFCKSIRDFYFMILVVSRQKKKSKQQQFVILNISPIPLKHFCLFGTLFTPKCNLQYYHTLCELDTILIFHFLKSVIVNTEQSWCPCWRTW